MILKINEHVIVNVYGITVLSIVNFDIRILFPVNLSKHCYFFKIAFFLLSFLYNGYIPLTNILAKHCILKLYADFNLVFIVKSGMTIK